MDYSILLCHGISPNDCSSIEIFHDENETLFFVKLKPNQRKCIYCGCTHTKIKEYKNKIIKSLPTGKNNTIISCLIPRYECPNCSKTYTHNLNIYATNSVSKVLKNKLQEKFASICTFKSIASDFNLSLTEVINIFDESCPDLRVPFSEAICIDEFANIRKSDYKFACVILDFYTHKIIDILPSRTTPYLDDYFSKIPLKIREKVKYVITDMYDGYISATKRWFRNAKIAIDPFHYMEYLTDAVQSIRRRTIDNSSNFFLDKSWMGKHWRLLSTNPNNFPNSSMALKSGMKISFYDRTLRFVKQDSELFYAFLFLQSVYLDLNHITFESAFDKISSIVRVLRNSSSLELANCGNTWNNYFEYIVNSFIKYKNRRLSNGPIEGTNKRVKELKNVMSGYRNTNRFYRRIILIQNKKR